MEREAHLGLDRAALRSSRFRVSWSTDITGISLRARFRKSRIWP
jgi:hypothetical protein